ncbi:MAG: Tm-1-like ATP-binding domain-containing protein [Pseudomonadota bacterium]
MESAATVLLVATMDTKWEEALYIERCLKQAGVNVLILDGGIRGESPVSVSIGREQVAMAGGRTLAQVQGIGHEGKALDVMIQGAIFHALGLYRQREIQGVIGLGGSMGTTLGTGVMRSFRVGVPKIMISTMASRDTRAFVGTKDVAMFHSVCDLSGLNRITRAILRNGAMALAGMVLGEVQETPSDKPPVILSTLGTTEACAKTVSKSLEREGREVIIFHTVGAGGMAMEETIHEEEIEAVLDLSLHEIGDHLFGGDYDSGPGRGSAALEKGVPTVLVPGNIDFLVTGPIEEAIKRFPGRPYHVHNSAITVVRTDHREIETLARHLAGLCNSARGPLALLVPMGGFSAFDSKGGPLHDPEGPGLFSKTLKENLSVDSTLHLLPYHINDPEFASAVIDTIKTLVCNRASAA